MTKVKIKETTSRDSIIKNILTSTDAGLNYLAMIVCKILDLSYDDFTFSLIHPNVSVNENIINSEVDIAMQNNDMIVNVEVNSTKGRKIERKNNNYICQLILKQTKKSSDYKSKYKKVYQINLNTYGVTKDKRFIVQSKILDVKEHEEVHPMFEIYDINLAKILDKDYTIVRKDKESLEKLLYLLICNDKEKIDKVYDGDEFMAKIIREVKTQEDEFDKLFYYNREILDDEMTLEEAKKEARDEALAEGRAEGLKEGRAEGLKEGRAEGLKEGKAEGLKEGRSEGLKKGKAEGVKQSKIDIAKAMLKENCVIELIAKVTDLSIKEIEKLKEELN